MSDRLEYEKYEKEEEKQEKDEEEKSWDEKWRRDPLSAAVWAAILIWAGLALLMENIGLLANVRILGARLEAWPLIFIGAGLLVFTEVIVRLLMPSYRRAVGGTLTFGIILVGIGLGNLFGWPIVGAVVLIAIGVSLLLRGFIRGL